MLGSRTKQVSAYGRRGHRIVNVSDRDDRYLKSNIVEIEETPKKPALPKKPSRRENALPLSPSPTKTVRVQRTFKQSKGSPVSPLAVAKKRVRLRKTLELKQLAELKIQDTPSRQPLTPIHTNFASLFPPLRSRTMKKKKKKKESQINGHKGTTSGVKKSYQPPPVALDIIVVDDSGRRLSQERRVSRTDVQVNPVTALFTREMRSKTTAREDVVSSDTEEEDWIIAKPFRKKTDRNVIVISSDDESEIELIERLHKISLAGPQKLSPASPQKTSRLQVEVVIPPAPYRLPKIKPPSPPPPPVSTYEPLVAPAPVAKPRQLTPIRRKNNRSVFQAPSIPTPSTPTDLDLSLDFSDFDITPSHQPKSSVCFSPEYLLPLLNECSQSNPYEFSAFIETFPFDPIVQPADAVTTDVKFRKIGEASYSEVFGIGDVVLKVIPLRDEEAGVVYNDIETPAPSDAKDVLREMIVTRAMGDFCDGFVKLLRTYVVRGRYPSLLIDLWDEYNERKGSESVRPDNFGLSQTYAIIVLPNGGPDLEAFTFTHTAKTGWHQACSIFWQVARTLSQAERLVNFEHRDLHWGQILVKTVPIPKAKRSIKMPMNDVRFGVKATIIDLGLSRMDADDAKTYWTPFDAEIFEGEGDYQFNIYRMMRDYNGNSWQGYRPFTNVMWLHYLVLKLLQLKRLKPPTPSKRTTPATNNPALGGYEEKECYDCLVEIEALLASRITAVTSKRSGAARKGTRKTQAVAAVEHGGIAAADVLKSAAGVIEYGIAKGWVKGCEL